MFMGFSPTFLYITGKQTNKSKDSLDRTKKYQKKKKKSEKNRYVLTLKILYDTTPYSE